MKKSPRNGFRNRDSKFLHRLICILAFASLSGGAWADTTVALYTFTGNSLLSSDSDPNSTASSFTDGSGLAGATSFANLGPTPPARSVTSNATALSLNGALLNNDYYSFTITPGEGIELNFTHFQATVGVVSNGLMGDVTLFSSIDGFAVPMQIMVHSVYGTTPNGNFDNLFEADLSSFATQSSAVEFRLYITDESSSSSDSVLVDNITVKADVVPEPTTCGLVILGLGSFLFFGRRPNSVR